MIFWRYERLSFVEREFLTNALVFSEFLNINEFYLYFKLDLCFSLFYLFTIFVFCFMSQDFRFVTHLEEGLVPAWELS